MTWFKKIIIFFVLVISAGSSFGLDTLKIDVHLDTLRKDLSGWVEYRLPFNSALKSFEFQLFPNVYSDKDTYYLRKNVGIRNHLINSGKWGEMVIDSVRLGNTDVTENLEIEYTKGRVPSVNGQSLSGQIVRIYFNTRIPEMGDRLSYYNNDYQLDGWFPRPAILLDDGTWYNPSYGPHSELIGRYRQYEIDFKLPKNLIVASPVSPIVTEFDDSLLNHHFSFGPAHDFALAISPDYLIDSSLVGKTQLYIYYRDFEHKAVETIKYSVGKTFDYMNSRIGEYAYDRFSVALNITSFSGGVEFPGLITMSSPKGMTMAIRIYDMLCAHETVHQWFYGMIGSNQIENPWLDEGITSFFTKKIADNIWGKEANLFNWAGITFSENDLFRAYAHVATGANSINEPTYQFVSEPEYFGTVYFRGAMAIETFDNLMTDSLSRIFWAEYYNRYLFGNPTTENFLELVGEITGVDLQQMLVQLINHHGDIDYAVYDLRNEQVDSITYRAGFILKRKGPLDIPIDYVMILNNGDTLHFEWHARQNMEDVYKIVPHPVSKIIIDPEFKIAIDNNLLNNSTAIDPDNLPATRLTSGVIFLVESFFSFIGGL